MYAGNTQQNHSSWIICGQLVSLLLLVVSAGLVVTTLVSVAKHDPVEVVRGFLLTLVLTAVLSALGFFAFRRKAGRRKLEPTARDAFFSVSIGWLLVSVIAALAFKLTIGLPWADAIFETSSGLTTTGATILNDPALFEPAQSAAQTEPAATPLYGVLFWRATLNWLGGVGIVFFVLLLLPMLKMGQSKLLYNAEVPGLKTTADQPTPHLFTSGMWVLAAYIGLTAAA